MEEKKNKNRFFIIVLLVLLLVSIGYIIYNKYYLNCPVCTNCVSNSNESKNLNVSVPVNDIMNNINEYDSVVLNIYSKSSNNSLNEYLNGINNNWKLIMGGINNGIKFNQIESNLISVFGSSINVKANDYYVNQNDKLATFIYNTNSDVYSLNPLIGGSDTFTDLIVNEGLYNYIMKDISYEDNKLSIEYYGLYLDIADIGPDHVSNGSNIGVDLYNTIDYDYTYDLKNKFDSNKNDFLIFNYIFAKNDNGYYLVDFKINNS